MGEGTSLEAKGGRAAPLYPEGLQNGVLSFYRRHRAARQGL